MKIIQSKTETMKINFKLYLAAAIAFTAMAGCKKNTFSVTERTTPTGVAFVKVAYLSPYNISNSTQVYFNGERLTNSLVYATSFPGSGMNMTGSTATSDYLAINPGTNRVEFIIPLPGTANPLTRIYDANATFQQDQRQTIYVTDTAASTLSFVLSDETATPDSGIYKLRFVNAIPNVASADLYKGPTAATAVAVKSDIKYGTGTEFMTFTSGTDSFFVRPAGSAATTTPIVRRGFPLGSQRIYSLVARGYNGQTSTSRGINLSVIINQ